MITGHEPYFSRIFIVIRHLIFNSNKNWKEMSILFLLTTLGTVATDLGHREESLRRKFKTEISNQFLTSFFFLTVELAAQIAGQI